MFEIEIVFKVHLNDCFKCIATGPSLSITYYFSADKIKVHCQIRTCNFTSLKDNSPSSISNLAIVNPRIQAPILPYLVASGGTVELVHLGNLGSGPSSAPISWITSGKPFPAISEYVFTPDKGKN